MSDNIQGDKIYGDKIGGDKVAGDKYVTHYHALPASDQEQYLEKARNLFNQLPLDAVPEPGPDSLTDDSRIVHSYNRFFVGRHDAFRTIARVLKENEAIIVTGIGGVGKTQLAAEFAHRYGRYFLGGVFWLSFADRAAIPAEITACGRNMELPGLHALNIDQQVKMVLSEWEEPPPRLLIFDNCEDEKLFDQYRPKSGGARILVTSRRGHWSRAFGITTLPLNQLARAESIQFLQRFWQRLTNDEAGKIAHALGDLPLALHLAGSYLAYFEGAVSPADFLAELKKAGPFHEALSGEIEGHSPTGHEQNIANTFALSYHQLAAGDPAHRVLLQLANLAPGEPVSYDLLRVALEVEKGQPADKELTVARRHLISLGLATAEPDRALRLHRLLHHFVRCVADEAVLVTALAALEEALNQEATRLNDTGFPATLLAWQNQLRYVTDNALSRQDEQGAALATSLGRHLRLVADFNGAKIYFEKALAIREEMLGPEHPDTAESLNNLGDLLRAKGDLTEAKDYFEQALTIREQSLGKNHPNTAASLNDLGLLLQDMGDLDGAKPYYERALTIRVNALGPDHSDTSDSLNNMGYILKSTGDLDGAKPYYEQALTIREKVLGTNHPHTAISLNSLGLLLREMGDLDGARSLLERALAIKEQALGPDHPGTATSLNNMGYLLQDLGNLEGARPYYERAMAIWERELGPNHPRTAISLNNLGRLLQDMGDLDKARTYYERALTIKEQSLGHDHPSTAITLNNLGLLLKAIGDLEGSRVKLERALAIREETLGPNHPRTAQSLNSVGLLLEAAGNQEGAKRAYDKALSVRQSVLGDDHPDTAESLHNLGSLLKEMGESATAKSYLKQALAIYEAKLGPDHPDTQLARQSLED